jgi:hypothetical protein
VFIALSGQRNITPVASKSQSKAINRESIGRETLRTLERTRRDPAFMEPRSVHEHTLKHFFIFLRIFAQVRASILAA